MFHFFRKPPESKKPAVPEPEADGFVLLGEHIYRELRSVFVYTQLEMAPFLFVTVYSLQEPDSDTLVCVKSYSF
ncbi:Umad1 [Phodopus roborovskii]|uniref:Umad1 protein n=1 Tax=Phodopus roborovskii TaxID=109678 RepID=A0AAU9YVR7_PHORO|nr:Umad1 [Phodopus roborovskii]